ncbi:MAG TPA: hypothetical protein VKA64_05080 [Gammaproteobacteria bacterium]|nr:hypothetical protein [Gammaproteobacteria bacterium]
MDPMATWEKVLLGIGGLLILLWFRPGIKAAIERSRNAERDWAGALIPLAQVILFVLALLALA